MTPTDALRCVLCHRLLLPDDPPTLAVVVKGEAAELCSRCQDKHLHDEPEDEPEGMAVGWLRIGRV